MLGAGTMGSAIAYLLAGAGIEVALIDLTDEAAERGLERCRRLAAEALARGRLAEAASAELVGRITAGASFGDAGGAGVLIEAVFEDPAVKARALAEIEPHLAADALLCSNTSSLPISGLAESVARPESFIGLHFFSPAEKMPLVEIVRGARTSEETVQRALGLAAALGKTAIVVRDSRGFFAGRVFATFIYEAIGMLVEGVPASMIEDACAQGGYPTPALALADELGLELLRAVRRQYAAAAATAGEPWERYPAERLIDELIDTHRRTGRRAGAGFYDYRDGMRVGLWAGLADIAPVLEPPVPPRELVERLLFIEAIEAVRCLDEGVVASARDANVGSLLGIGYPDWTGGVLAYVERYGGGASGFVARARELAGAYGERFLPPASLVRLCAATSRG